MYEAHECEWNLVCTGVSNVCILKVDLTKEETTTESALYSHDLISFRNPQGMTS